MYKLIVKIKMYLILRVYAKWAKQIVGEKVLIDWCSDFAAIPEPPYEIWIGMLTAQTPWEVMIKFLNENFTHSFSLGKFEIFILGFLHEVGHIMTDWQFDDYIRDFDKDTISFEDYHCLPDEFAANQWLMEYLEQNGRIALQWQEKLKAAYSRVSQKDLEIWLKYYKMRKPKIKKTA